MMICDEIRVVGVQKRLFEELSLFSLSLSHSHSLSRVLPRATKGVGVVAHRGKRRREQQQRLRLRVVFFLESVFKVFRGAQNVSLSLQSQNTKQYKP